LPATEISASRLPTVSARLIANSTLGPGTTIIRKVSAAKAASWPGDTMARA
jgi:hypothetical protein